MESVYFIDAWGILGQRFPGGEGGIKVKQREIFERMPSTRADWQNFNDREEDYPYAAKKDYS